MKIDENIVREFIERYLEDREIDPMEFEYFLISTSGDSMEVLELYEGEQDLEKWVGLGETWRDGATLYSHSGEPAFCWRGHGWEPCD